MNDKKDFFRGITNKLTILMGGAVLLTGAQASANTAMSSTTSDSISVGAIGARKPLPAKLTLKQQTNGFKLVAAHGSHSSHASHASHASHSSRAS